MQVTDWKDLSPKWRVDGDVKSYSVMHSPRRDRKLSLPCSEVAATEIRSSDSASVHPSRFLHSWPLRVEQTAALTAADVYIRVVI